MVNNKQKDVLIIIPAFNEEGSIPTVIEQLEENHVRDFADILIINDASTDSTGRIVRSKNYKMITNVFNLGYGGALQMGYKFAVRRKYDYVIQMDADGQHDVCNIPKIYEKLTTPEEDGRYPDIVMASRFMEGSAPFKVSFFKKTAIGLFREMIYWGTGEKISDPTSGLQGFNRRTVLYYSQFGKFVAGSPDADIITQVLLLGFQVREIPAVMHPRIAGESMYTGIAPVVYMFRMVLSILGVNVRFRLMNTAGEVEELDENVEYAE